MKKLIRINNSVIELKEEKEVLENIAKEIPYQMLVEYSSGTDSVDVFFENVEEYKEDGENVLQTLVKMTKELYDTYYEKGENRHINSYLHVEDKETWKEETKELRAFMKYLEKEIKAKRV